MAMNETAGAATGKAVETDGIALPQTARTFAGGVFHPSDDVWEVWAPAMRHRLDFTAVRGADPSLIGPMKAVLSWYAQHRAADHAANMFKHAKSLFADASARSGGPIDNITNMHLMNWRDSLGEHREYWLSSLAGFLKRWHAFGHPGVDHSAIDYLRKVRLSGNRKGTAVLTMDPVNGPFSDLEFEAIHAALTEAFRKGFLSLENYLATRLFMLLGSRPVQITLLKVCDIVEVINPDDTNFYWLSVPRAKQRNVEPRGHFRKRPLIPDIGALLLEYCARVRKTFTEKRLDPATAPMFPSDAADPMAPMGLEWHLSSSSLSNKVRRAFATIAPRSERTGEPIEMTPMRFRRTLGTRAAAEGHGALIIAEMLDHADTQNVQVYIEARPETIRRIDKAIAIQMAPLAQAFAGTVSFGDDDSRPRITDPRFDTAKPVGSCGQQSHCAFSAPVACYTCGSFHAWVDGPHEAVLEHLLAEEERLMRIVDERIATVNRRAILAVAEVVRLCAERRETAHG